jgi:hypothetical protein
MESLEDLLSRIGITLKLSIINGLEQALLLEALVRYRKDL